MCLYILLIKKKNFTMYMYVNKLVVIYPDIIVKPFCILSVLIEIQINNLRNLYFFFIIVLHNVIVFDPHTNK